MSIDKKEVERDEIPGDCDKSDNVDNRNKADSLAESGGDS
jgi:hypothetical protein